jgi:Icc protein
MTLRVLQITDLHLTAMLGSKLYGVDTAHALKNIVSAIKQLHTTPDVIIATGDLAEDGSKKAYKRLRELLSELNIPVYVLPGNHDDLSQMRSSFNSDGFFCTSRANIGDWGFIFVNSQVIGHSHGFVSPTDLTELKNNISDLDGKPILVALHHTPTNVCPSFGCQLKNSKEFTDLLNQHPNIKGVIAGHTHNASEVNAGKHVQFTTPSTFAHVSHAQLGESVVHDDFWASHSLDGSLQGFRILDLLPNGVIRSEVHWLNKHDT